MAVYDQQVTTYSDTTPHIRIISNVIQLIDPVDTPLIEALGGLDAARSKFKIGGNGYKIELLEDEYAPIETTANQGTTITTNATQITVADASIFQDGHVILIDSEYMVVKATGGTEQITVYNRTYGGTNATHLATAAISIVGMARLEGDDTDFVGLVDITAPFNYVSTLEKGLNISGKQQVIDQYGIEDEFSYQAQKAIPELLRLLERAIFHGIRDAGSAANPSSFGGLGTFISNNVVTTTQAITKTNVDSLMELIILDGGNPDLFVLHPSVANDLRAILDTSSFVNLTQDNTKFGMSPITRVDTQYGSLRMVQSRWCPLAKAYMLDSRKVGLYTLRPFGWKRLGLTGDSTKGEVVGDFSLMVANDKAHGYISGLTS